MNDRTKRKKHFSVDMSDPLDPATQIVLSAKEAAKSIVEQNRDDLLQSNADALLENIGGGPRPNLAGTAYIQVHGEEGLLVRSGSRVCGGERDAKIFTDDFMLSRLTNAFGVQGTSSMFSLSEVVDLEEWLEDGEVDCQKLNAVVLGISVPGLGKSFVTPGIFWKAPVPILDGLKSVAAVDANSAVELSWKREVDGGIFVMPQSIEDVRPVELYDGNWVYLIQFELPIEPDQLGRIAPPLCNIAQVEEEITGSGSCLAKGTLAEFVERHPGLTLSQPFDGKPMRLGENRRQWRNRIRSEIRHGNRFVTTQDFRDGISTEFPDLELIDVSATRVLRGNCHQDAIRLTIAPKEWDKIETLLDCSITAARQLELFFDGKTLPQTIVVAGPPAIIVSNYPNTSSRLWLYQKFLVRNDEVPQDQKVCRDGVYWPARSLAMMKESK